jgi:ligand-binding sensor domain-containing protein
MKKRYPSCFFLFLIISSAYAQSPIKNKILNYSLKNGLSFGIVNSITQDDKGFMWFATNDGLNRFDGTSFKVFKSRQGDSTTLASNYVQKVLSDVHGNIWVSSRNGLSKLDTRTEKFIHYKLKLNKAVKSDIGNIIQSHDGNLWITSYNLGFSYFDIKTASFINYTQINLPHLASNRVICLFEDSKGLLWAGTQEGGINIFRHKDGVIDKKEGLLPQ